MGDHEAILLKVYGIRGPDEQWNCSECGRALFRGNPATGYDPTQSVGTYITQGEAPGGFRGMDEIGKGINASVAI